MSEGSLSPPAKGALLVGFGLIALGKIVGTGDAIVAQADAPRNDWASFWADLLQSNGGLTVLATLVYFGAVSRSLPPAVRTTMLGVATFMWIWGWGVLEALRRIVGVGF